MNIKPSDLKKDLADLDSAKKQLSSQSAQAKEIDTQIVAVQRRRSDLYDPYKKSIEPLSTELKSVRSNLRNSQNKDSADYNLKLIEAETARVQSQVKTLGALGDLNSIKTKILDDKQKLAAIEAAVDRTITGAYLKQKMANLLMDQNGPLCKAAKACGGKPADAVTAKDLEKLFPVSKSSSGSPASSPSAPAAIQ